MGTGSRFSTASVFAFAFSAKPASVRIVDAFESVFASAVRSSLTLTEVDPWMLDDECFGNSAKIAFVTDRSLYHDSLFACHTAGDPSCMSDRCRSLR